MTEPDLNFIAERLDLIQTELRDIRTEMQEMRTDTAVLTNMMMNVLRDMEQVKRLLGRMDARIAHLEDRQ